MDIEYILNDALGKALITHRIKGTPNSNKIAVFVSEYLKNIPKGNKFTYNFDSKEQAQKVRSQMQMSHARNYILEQTEDFESKLLEFINNYE